VNATRREWRDEVCFASVTKIYVQFIKRITRVCVAAYVEKLLDCACVLYCYLVSNHFCNVVCTAVLSLPPFKFLAYTNIQSPTSNLQHLLVLYMYEVQAVL